LKIGCALFLAFNFEWTSQVTSNVEDLSVEKQEVVRSAPVWEDDGVDSLWLNLCHSQWVVLRVGSIEGVDIVLSAGEGVVAVLVDRGSGILRLEVWEVLAELWAIGLPNRTLHSIIFANGEVVRSTADLNISFKETTGNTLSIYDWG
jgi:hypothetical protein